MNKKKSGFISMALVYTFLVIFLFLMLAILRTYIEKDKFLETINSQINEDINKDKQNRSFALSKMIEDNSPQNYESLNLVQPASNDFGNGNGLYYISNASITNENNDDETTRIYFYRGSVENNHLVYANSCFRILRTNEDGSLRLVYDGPVSGNKCKELSEKTGVSVGTVKFSETETLNLIEPVNGLVPSYDDNNTHSEIIDKLNDWFLNSFMNPNDDGRNFTDNISKNTLFCNNKKYSSTNSNIKYYESKKLIPVFKSESNRDKYDPKALTNSFSLVCSEENDKLSANEKTLSYPVGLLTAEDVLLAGGYLTDSSDEYVGGPEGIINTKFYLYTGSSFWTSTAYSTDLNTGYNYVIAVNSNGYMEGKHVTETADVIPVISLDSSVRISSGNGTANNPYRVD